MNQETSTTPNPEALKAAFDALKSYNTGSPRGSLCPVDAAVAEAGSNSKAKPALEDRLLNILKDRPAFPAVEYICAKLSLIGSAACVPALAELLKDPATSTAARNALEKIPHEKAPRALRDGLPKLGQKEKTGVIQSLGARRDNESVSILRPCLKEATPGVAGAAAAALGEIGSAKAAKALKPVLSAGSPAVRIAAADAALVCAEQLAAAGQKADAKSLYEAVLASKPPAHIQPAALRGLAECAPARAHKSGT